MASDLWTGRHGQLCYLRQVVVAACLGRLLGGVGVDATAGVTGKIYWSDAGKNSIRRSNLDGSDVEDLIHTGNDTHPHGIALDLEGGKIYWCAFGTKEIKRANLDGTGSETVLNTSRNPEGLALDRTSSKIYWTDVEGRVQRANLDGHATEGVVQAGFVRRNSVVADGLGEKIYWPEEDPTYASIYQSNQDGTEPAVIISTDDELVSNPQDDIYAPLGIAVDVQNGKVYWSDTVTDTISRANLDGSGVEVLVSSGLFSVVGLALDIDRGKLYWVDRGKPFTGDFDAVSRSNLDGSDVELLVSHGHAEVRDIAVVPMDRIAELQGELEAVPPEKKTPEEKKQNILDKLEKLNEKLEASKKPKQQEKLKAKIEKLSEKLDMLEDSGDSDGDDDEGEEDDE